MDTKKKSEQYLFAHTITAQPDWYAVDICIDLDDYENQNPDAKPHVYEEPIISWFIEVERGKDDPAIYLTPITHNKLSSLYQGAIKRPDGSVAIRGVGEWNNVDEYREHVRQTQHNMATAAFNRECGYAGYPIR